ncbi:MAG: glycosyl hydrolase family 18 protein, partial [Myxococcota bacterium]
MVLLTIAAALAEPVPGVHLEHARQFQHNPPDRRSPTPHPPPPDAPSPTVTVYGYHAYWTGSPLDIDYSRLSHIAIFNVALSSDGSLTDTQRWTNVAGDVVPLAHAYGVSVHLCVTSFTDPVTNAVLSDPSRRATAISQLADLVDQFDADGVNVDVEGLDAAQKSNFVSFIEELSVAVDEIVIATPAVDWQGAYDYDQLAALSDGLFIMGYGYHYSGSNPGPNAPLYGGSPWGRYSLDWSVNDHLEFGAPADKIILGLPLYGREWPTDGPDVPGTATGSGVAVFMEDALDRVATQPPLFDDVTRTPYMLGDDWQLWYDDVSSLRERISYAVDRELQGVGFWALQYEGEDSGFWEMVSEETVLLEDDPLETDTGLDTPAENAPPIARAGQPIEANVGDIVVLNGSA